MRQIEHDNVLEMAVYLAPEPPHSRLTNRRRAPNGRRVTKTTSCLLIGPDRGAEVISYCKAESAASVRASSRVSGRPATQALLMESRTNNKVARAQRAKVPAPLCSAGNRVRWNSSCPKVLAQS